MADTSRFSRVVDRDIVEETSSEFQVRRWQETLARPIVFTQEDIERMKYFLERDEKKAALQAREEAELRAAYLALVA